LVWLNIKSVFCTTVEATTVLTTTVEPTIEPRVRGEQTKSTPLFLKV